MSDQLEVPPMSRETLAAVRRGIQTGVIACLLIVESKAEDAPKSKTEIAARMRSWLNNNVPRA